MSRFRGILFDFDGTLVKTMEYHYAAWRHVLKEYAVDLREEDYYPLEGMPVGEIAAIFAAQAAPALVSPDVFPKIVKKKEQYYLAHHSGLEFYPGVESLIGELDHSGVPMGIVTAGLRPRVESTVPKDFLKHFRVLITGDDLARGKPHPDPYLKGAKALKLNPKDCVVVENAPLGVQSAKSAGAYCVAVCSTMGRGHLEKADAVVETFEDFGKLPMVGEMLRQDPVKLEK